MRTRSVLIAAIVSLACAGAAFVHGEDFQPPRAKESYAVVTTRATYALADWKAVVEALRKKYDADLVLCEKSVLEAGDALRRCAPNYACFVVRPAEAGRGTVVGIHRLTRRLNDDPYSDLLWGILTGYDAGDALRIVQRSEPLVIRRAASSMGPGIFKDLEAGFASHESDQHAFSSKKVGGQSVTIKVDPDPAKALAEAFNTLAPDVFVTSGHASEHDWQIIFNNPRGGQFRCQHGQLLAVSSDGNRYSINSPNPKVYLPAGNCLIGHVPGPDCMALAWMHTGGVHQMLGYTAVTFHGYMGWGAGALFEQFPGRYTLAEAFYFINQSLIHELQTHFPKQAAIEFDRYDLWAIEKQMQKFGITDRTLLGHLWDRDVVAFYGDPAWPVRWPAKKSPWTHTFEQHQGKFLLRITAREDGKWGQYPLLIWLPERLRKVGAITCSVDAKPVVTESFVLVPLMDRARKAGETIEVRFEGEAAPRHRTSATSAPVAASDPKALAAAPAAAQPAGAGGEIRLRVPDVETGNAVAMALHAAGENNVELVKALQQSEDDVAECMAYLVANMPLRDLRTLKADFLLENVRLALKARDETRWGKQLPPEIFFEGVLPYASLNEQREPWRKDLFARFLPIAKQCASPGEAALRLNKEVFEQLPVKYHATKRPKPDQSPSESIKAGYASCTGLSILLVDACRAVGVPARVVGVPRWPDNPGNHTWVEVWDRGWHYLGASESQKLDEAWFTKGAAATAAAADPARPWERIYAASFKRRPLRFPLPWNPYIDDVSAIDVTESYRQPRSGH